MGNYFGPILFIFIASQTILISPIPFFKAGRHCLVAFTTELFQPFLAIIMVDIMVLVLLSSYGYQFHHKNAKSTNIILGTNKTSIQHIQISHNGEVLVEKV